MAFALFVFSVVATKVLSCAATRNDSTLELLQVFFRHGNRTALRVPEQYETWYLNTFTPFQYGQLITNGRRQMFDAGTYLRNRYGNFLPEEFSYSGVSVKCTADHRVQESSAVTMATIFPPKTKQQWQACGLGAKWTPIPCEYVPGSQDMVLDPANANCPRYNYLLKSYLNSTFFRNKYIELTCNGTVNKYIQQSLNISTPVDYVTVGVIVENFLAMEDYKIPLPAWASAVWPDPITTMYLYEFMAYYSSTEMIRLSVGEFFKEILNVATLLENNQLTPKSRKLFTYFGHDKTIYPFLHALGFENFVPFCVYGAAIIMELHRNQTTSEIGYKFLYRNGTGEAIQYTVPGCQEICPLSYVKKYLEPYIPTKPYYDYCK